MQKYANLVELEKCCQNAYFELFSCKISLWYSRERTRQKFTKNFGKFANFANSANPSRWDAHDVADAGLAVDGEEEVEQEGLPRAEADRREARPLDAEAPAWGINW